MLEFFPPYALRQEGRVTGDYLQVYQDGGLATRYWTIPSTFRMVALRVERDDFGGDRLTEKIYLLGTDGRERWGVTKIF